MYRLLCLALLGVASLAQAQTGDPGLRGITGVTASVDLKLPDGGEPPDGITHDRLQSLLESQLRSAGIQVLSAEEDQREGGIAPRAYLYAAVVVVKSGDIPQGYAFYEQLQVLVAGTVPMNGASAPLQVWRDDMLGQSGLSNGSKRIEGGLGALATQLGHDWLAANPR